jgi:hypothetical protein
VRAEPEKLRRREPGQGAVAGQLDQAAKTDPRLDLVALPPERALLGRQGVQSAAEPLALLRVRRPYRAAWLVTGEPDGWARPGKRVRFLVFGGPHELVVAVRAPYEPARTRRFVLRGGGTVRTGQVPPGAVVRRSVTVCGGATLLARGGALHLDRIAVRPRPGQC